MKYALMEQKFILQESKFLLDEALTQDDISKAIEKVDAKLQQFSSNKLSSLQTAYDDYKVTLGRTQTTANSTSDFTAVKDALKAFWSTFKATKAIYNDDLDTPDAITGLLNKHSGLIKRVDNLVSGDAALPTDDGNEINKKLWLKAAIDVENTFGDLIPELQVGLNMGSNDVITKKNLEFIKKSLVIFRNSLSLIKDEQNLQNVETIVSKINNSEAHALDDAKNIANTMTELKNINVKIKDSDDAANFEVGEKLAKDASWDELYKSMANKNKFWEKYFAEFWGANANKIKSLGSVFKQECEVYGFTDSNPFIKYLKGFLLKFNITFTSAQYQSIHNAIASGRGGKVKDLNDLGSKTGNADSIVNKGHNILAYTDLYTKPGKDIETYMYYAQIVSAKASADAEFSKIFFHADNKTLKPLTEINSALNTLGWDEKVLSTNDVDLIAKLILSDKTSTDTKEIYVLMLWTYFLETDDQDKYQAKLDIDALSKRHLAGIVKNAKKTFTQKYGKPTSAQAREILNKVISGMENKE